MPVQAVFEWQARLLAGRPWEKRLMSMMVHLTPAKNIRQILRTGMHKDEDGVYCMLVLQE